MHSPFTDDLLRIPRVLPRGRIAATPTEDGAREPIPEADETVGRDEDDGEEDEADDRVEAAADGTGQS